MLRWNFTRSSLVKIMILIVALVSFKIENSNIMYTTLIFLTVLTCSLEFLAIFLASTMMILDGLRFVAKFNSNWNIESIDKIVIFLILFTILKYTYKEKDPLIIKTIQQYWILFVPILIIGIVPIVLGPRYILEQLFRGYDNVGHLAIMNSLTNCREFLTQCLNAKNTIPNTYNQYPQQWHVLFAQDPGSNIPILYWYWIAITITLVLAVLILIKSINYMGQNASIQPISVFRLLAACLLIIAMGSQGYVNYVFSIALLIMGFALCRTLQTSGLILGSTILTFAVASYTLFIPAIGIWLLLQLSQYKLLVKKELIYLIFYMSFFTTYTFITLLNASRNGQLNALDEISGSWKVTIPIIITIGTIMFKSISRQLIRSNLEVYAFLFSSILIQIYLFYKNQIGGYFLFKNVVVLLILFLLSNMQLQNFINPAKTVFLNFVKKIAKQNGYKIKINGTEKNYQQVSKTSVAYAIIIISIIWNAMPSNAIPSPVEDFSGRMKVFAFGEVNRAAIIIDTVEQTSQGASPFIYLSPDYYFFTQWIAALNGKWSTTLQQNIDQIVTKKGLFGNPDLLDVNEGIASWIPKAIYND